MGLNTSELDSSISLILEGCIGLFIFVLVLYNTQYTRYSKYERTLFPRHLHPTPFTGS